MALGKPWVRPRHQVVHDLILYPVRALLRLLYGYRAQPSPRRRGSGPCLILSNHVTPLDPLCLGASFDFPIYYVASDHIFRLGWISRLLKFLVEPIPIVKSRVDLRTVKDMMTIVREGGAVCLYPEGNRTYNGAPVRFTHAAAKFARQLGVPLLLFRIEGGYFTAPRWADTIRRGSMTGRVVREVSAEELKSMPVDDLHGLITAELNENAYERQRAHPVRFRGRRLAESLERVLYLCPNCHGMATIHSHGDMAACECGLAARYTEYGLLEPAGAVGLPFKTVLEWDLWQKGALPQWLEGRLAEAGDGPLLKDHDVRLYSAGRAGKNTLIGEGAVALHADRFRFVGEGATLDFGLKGIDRVIIHGKQALQFTHEEVTYEVKTARPFSALKYMNVYELLQQRNREVPNGLFSL